MKESIKQLIGNFNYEEDNCKHYIYYIISEMFTTIVYEKESGHTFCLFQNNIYEEQDFESLSKLKVFW